MIEWRLSIGEHSTLQYGSTLKETIDQTIGTIPNNTKNQQSGIWTQDSLYLEVHPSYCQWVIPNILC